MNTLFKNVTYLSIANFISVLISISAGFYIPLKLGPELYGNFVIIITFISIFNTLSLDGYNKVLLREISKKSSNQQVFFYNNSIIKIIFSFVSILICNLALWFSNYDTIIKYLIFLMSITILLNSYNSLLHIVIQANQNMKWLSFLSILRSLFIYSTSILILFLGFSITELIFGRIIIILLLLIFSFLITKKIYFSPKIKFSFQKINFSYLKQSVNLSFLEILQVLSTKIDIVMLSYMASPYQLGIYSFAYNLVEKGYLVRQPIATALFPEYSVRISENRFRYKDLKNHTFKFMIPSITIIIATFLLSEVIINNILGQKFHESIYIVNILICNLMFTFMIIPSSYFLLANGCEKNIIKYALLRSILNISLNVILFNIYGIVGVAISTLITFLFYFIALFVLSKNKLQRKKL